MVAERVSGITFQRCDNPRFAVSHAERTDLCGPKYLLPQNLQLENVVLHGLGTEDDIAMLYQKRMANLSRQAKAAKASPFIEGVFVLPEYDGESDYKKRVGDLCMNFKREFEEKTGCTVLHMSMHLDEGYVDEHGEAILNTHVHFLVDKTLANGKMWKPGPAGLAKVQTLLAETLEMKRGSTIQERGGRPARKHIPHDLYREIKEREREREQALIAGNQKTVDDVIAFKDESTRSKIKHAESKGDLKAAYSLIRGFLKGSGLAKQSDYQKLKQLFEEKSASISTWAEYVESRDKPDAESLLWAIRDDDLELLKERRGRDLGALGVGPAGHLPEGQGVALIAPLTRWIREDADLYLLPQKNEAGKRLAFEDKGDRISVKLSNDFEVLAAALKLAAVKWPQGFEIRGDAEFKSFASEVATTIGLENLIQSIPKTERGDDYDYAR